MGILRLGASLRPSQLPLEWHPVPLGPALKAGTHNYLLSISFKHLKGLCPSKEAGAHCHLLPPCSEFACPIWETLIPAPDVPPESQFPFSYCKALNTTVSYVKQ